MRSYILVLLTALLFTFLRDSSQAQVVVPYPAAPATKLESFETNVSTVIIKATTEIGSLSVDTGVVTVRCREMTEAGSSRMERGIAMDIAQKGEPRDKLLIDYDEIPGLLNVIDYLNKINFSVTRLNIFDATFTTKGGVRIAALARQRTGAIQFAVMDVRTNLPPVILSRDEMSRFGGLIDEAKRKLDSVRGG